MSQKTVMGSELSRHARGHSESCRCKKGFRGSYVRGKPGEEGKKKSDGVEAKVVEFGSEKELPSSARDTATKSIGTSGVEREKVGALKGECFT